MAEQKKTPATVNTIQRVSWAYFVLLVVVAPVAIAVLVYRVDEFDPAPLPDHGLSRVTVEVPKHNNRVLDAAERVGDGLLHGPEDLAYDAESGIIYTGCSDGWIKQVTVKDSAEQTRVENWVYVGGRPLGLAFGPDKQLIVAESYKGLLKVNREGLVELLTDEADGVKFRLTDGVDVANDGMIYFTDASYKYDLDHHMLDILEGRPYGRLMSFDPSTNQTQILVRHLYFANGVALSPDQSFLVFCETPRRRCSKYHIKGERKGSVDNFIDNLPGFPDNIRYDGDGHFWIALPSAKTLSWDVVLRYPYVRKTMAILSKYMHLPNIQRDGGVLAVNLEGKAVALYSDPSLSMVSGGLKIGKYLYYGNLENAHFTRINLTRHAASASS